MAVNDFNALSRRDINAFGLNMINLNFILKLIIIT